MDLVGKYKLVDYSIINENGKVSKWEGTQEGELEYTKDFGVSVKIVRKSTKANLSEVEKKKMNLWYEGVYEVISSQQVSHTISSASDYNRIGEKLIRNYFVESNLLVISGKGLSLQVELIWEKNA